MFRLFKGLNSQMEECFNIEAATPLTEEQLRKLRLILADGFIIESVRKKYLDSGQGQFS